MKKKDVSKTKKVEFSRPVEMYFDQMNTSYTQGNPAIYAVLLAFVFFGVMGLIWMIPFPQFDFLVRMNAHTFLNWGSFFIAILVYSYLKLAPTLSYAVLFSIAIMSFFIVQLEYVERDGGPTVVLVCSIIAILSLGGLWLYSRKEPKLTISDFIRMLAVGPIWLWSKVFDCLKWKY